MCKKLFPSIRSLILAAALLLPVPCGAAAAGEKDWISLGPENDFAAWRRPAGGWREVGDATLDPNDPTRLAGKPGKGVMINGRDGRTPSLVTKRGDFRDVELHVEFMVARRSNSGVIFHGNYEIQILDSHGVKHPTASQSGGVYPRAEAKPTYHYLDAGSPPRVNAAKPPGKWQTLDIIFQAARFDPSGARKANARFVKVVLNGKVIQENVEVPYASGLNWGRKQHPQGPIILQGDYGPIAFRNVRVRPWKPRAGSGAVRKLNVAPPGFTALFNGKDFTGWRLSPLARKSWAVEDGALKTYNPLDRWGADLSTARSYKDFTLMLDFRFPEISDSGINFRRLIPPMGDFGQTEQLNIRSRGGLCKLESFEFMPQEVRTKLGLKTADVPRVPHIDPEIGTWHTIELTVMGRRASVRYDGKLLLDRFQYPEGLLSTEPAPIRLQKHIRTEIAGKTRDCPVEYRNIFIKDLEASRSAVKAGDARQILDAAGVQGGLVVVIGCGQRELLAGLRAGDAYLVHGLDRDPRKVAAARRYLLEKGCHGSVTVSRWQGSRLPFCDGSVNLLVVASDAQQLSAGERQRVLAPLGVFADAGRSRVEVVRKAWPADLDGWTHFLHDASNNAVSRDTVVGPPRGLRWTCGPKYARSHEHLASMSAMVTAGGRIFYIIDEGPISSVYLPPRWKLVARDAFSGVLLWEHPITNWESHLRGFRSGPPEIGRRMVAASDRLYVSLGYGEPVTVLDAPTGKPLATLEGTVGARELLLADGVLYVLADDLTAAEHEKRGAWIERVWPKLEIWYRFPRAAITMYGTQRIAALRPGTGKPMWQKGFQDPGEILPATMALDSGRLCVQTVSHVVCLEGATGKELWRSPHPVARSRFSWSTPALVIDDGVVLVADRVAKDNVGGSPPARGSRWIISSGGSQRKQQGELIALSLDDGRRLWRAPCFENYNAPIDVFVVGGVVWVGDLRRGVDPGFTEGRDLKTGRVVARFPPQKAYGHHRCYRNKATERWFLVGRGGIQFIDARSGAVKNASWVRGGCQYGVLPANGLVYAPPHSCACQPRELIVGFNALSAQPAAGKGDVEPERLEQGPARDAGPAAFAPGSPLATDWPTYRRDASRSGHQDLPAPGEPQVAWARRLAGPITAPVVSGGLVLVAEERRHVLRALSASDGKPAWAFAAGGAIDSPPTLWGGLCLFGTRSGFVNCLRAADGTMAWRFRAAPLDRRLLAGGQLESVWPVHGSVLVDDKLSGGVPAVYFAAGRSSHLDGGIRVYALEAATGKLLRQATVSRTAGGAGAIRQGALPDILSLQHGAIWMRALGVDGKLAPVPPRPHLFAPRGFLDGTWWHRTYWICGTAVDGGYQGWPKAGNTVPAGRFLVTDGGDLIYGYGRMAYREGGGHVRPPATGHYKLFASSGRRQVLWTTELPFVPRAIVLARDALLVAGGRSLPGSEGDCGPGTFWIISRQSGEKREECPLPAPPVPDGIAYAGAGLFIAAADGSVLCLRSKNTKNTKNHPR